jgi:hypothetical protein
MFYEIEPGGADVGVGGKVLLIVLGWTEFFFISF